jgi:hypothetical protein
MVDKGATCRLVSTAKKASIAFSHEAGRREVEGDAQRCDASERD